MFAKASAALSLNSLLPILFRFILVLVIISWDTKLLWSPPFFSLYVYNKRRISEEACPWARTLCEAL